MEAAMGLMRRMPPKHTETALSALLSLLPDHSSDLLSQIDQPLQVLCDVDNAKEFILCEYNRDADSYRSPWSNKYHPPLEEGMHPSPELRKLEVEANEIFTVYRDQYYEGGISSVYLWEEDDNEAFVACFLIKKGSIRRQMKADLCVEDGHLCNMGKMIEELEGKLRNQLDQVYFGKTKEMVCTLRPPSELLPMALPDSRKP